MDHLSIQQSDFTGELIYANPGGSELLRRLDLIIKRCSQTRQRGGKSPELNPNSQQRGPNSG
jgi:hypothetical protein